MSSGFEAPSFEALVAEQARVQSGKFQGRLLGEYEKYLLPGQAWLPPRGSEVADFVRPLCGENEPITLEGIFRGFSDARSGQPINWVDMGGGRALPMRQLGSQGRLPGLRMTDVDLFDLGLDGLEPDELAYLEGLAPGMTIETANPNLIIGDVGTVRLPFLADVITSVEVVQYLDNPLGALANWYNQLADDGIMLVAAEHTWSEWIRQRRTTGSSKNIARLLLGELAGANIDFAATDEVGRRNGTRPERDPGLFRTLAVRKRPGTRLRVDWPVCEVYVNPYDFKTVFYEAPDSDTPILEIARESSFEMRL
jgi:hypothetical protein